MHIKVGGTGVPSITFVLNPSELVNFLFQCQEQIESQQITVGKQYTVVEKEKSPAVSE
jgi:hypothetical protein